MARFDLKSIRSAASTGLILLQSAKLTVGRKYKVKSDLADAPSSFVRGEVLTFVRATKTAAEDHIICEFRAADGGLKYLDLSGPSCRDWRDLMSPVSWLS